MHVLLQMIFISQSTGAINLRANITWRIFRAIFPLLTKHISSEGIELLKSLNVYICASFRFIERRPFSFSIQRS